MAGTTGHMEKRAGPGTATGSAAGYGFIKTMVTEHFTVGFLAKIHCCRGFNKISFQESWELGESANLLWKCYNHHQLGRGVLVLCLMDL